MTYVVLLDSSKVIAVCTSVSVSDGRIDKFVKI